MAEAARDPARYRRLLDLLGQALDLPAATRATWVDALGDTDAGLRDDLHRLLAHADDSSNGARVDAGAGALAATLMDAPEQSFAAGDAIGAYVLERPLGEGGLGVVWLARRQGNAALPPVAIKMPATTGGTRTAAERLSREGAILAALNHPNIARLIEVGVHGTGADAAPFLALEYVDGQRLPNYCDSRQMPPEARLKLFVRVLDAVVYAHSALVLHRDLKPGNILVTTNGEVKLLDFGIAKLMDNTGSAGSTQLTRLAGRALTPDYASPEQIAGVPLTVASDVYSLGVVLFELLTGERPYRLKRGSAAELEEAILTADTGRPSTVVRAEFAARTQESISRLRRKLSGDLDTIVLKSLKKSPAERYGSALAFKEDIERYLAGQPVLATPDSTAYRMRKFIGRNRVAVGAAAGILVALVTGLAAALWQAAEAREQTRLAAVERARAVERFNDVRAIANSLIFEVHDAILYLPGATDARALLTKKAVAFLDKLAADPSRDAALTRELAAGYQKIAEAKNYTLAANLGDAAGANQNHEQALALMAPLARRPDAAAEDMATLANVLLSYSVSLLEQGKVTRAAELNSEGTALRRRLAEMAPADADRRRDLLAAENYLANVRHELDDLSGAQAANESVLAGFSQLVNEDPKSARNRWGQICGYENTAAMLIHQGNDAAAVPRLQRAIALADALSIDKPDHYSILTGYGHYHQMLGEIALRSGDLAGARRSLEAALKFRRGLVARDAKDVEAAINLAATEAKLAVLNERQGKAGATVRSEARARLKALLQERPTSRRVQVAWVELLADSPDCRERAEAQTTLDKLRTAYPELASLKRLRVQPCPTQG